MEPNADESWPPGSVEDGVVTLAQRKLNAVGVQSLPTVAADTVVVLGEARLGKPEAAGEAVRMLRSLAGQEHRVLTGFCVRHGARERHGFVSTRIVFRPLSQSEIEAYVATAEPLDKAGGYAIQGGGGAFVDQIFGSYTNVVGLPLAEVLAALQAVT